MAPKRATRSTPVTTTPAPTATTTTSVTNAQLQAMIDQGVTAALAARDANRNGDDSHTSGTGGRRTKRVAYGHYQLIFDKMELVDKALKSLFALVPISINLSLFSILKLIWLAYLRAARSLLALRNAAAAEKNSLIPKPLLGSFVIQTPKRFLN
ncbi:hypothetical protein Tco_0752411 [Tanacetum coccineum]|uniref:Uncharacterized protein n=1 Tax=Tanacetum coccineum TaxID=301880 RepID=A0ABQ4Z9Z8_9ASTR